MGLEVPSLKNRMISMEELAIIQIYFVLATQLDPNFILLYWIFIMCMGILYSVNYVTP